MVEKRRFLDAADVDRLEGLGGIEKARVWAELTGKRRKGKYGDSHRESAQTLILPSEGVREGMFNDGRMVFTSLDGDREYGLPLDTQGCHLVMPFTVGKELYTTRFYPKAQSLIVSEVKGATEYVGQSVDFVDCNPRDTGHLLLPMIKQRNLTLRLMKIARDHAVAVSDNHEATAHLFLRQYVDLFERAGYEKTGGEPLNPHIRSVIEQQERQLRQYGADYEKAGKLDNMVTMKYRREPNPQNNLYENYRILGYDPETGKVKSAYHRIKKQ